MWRDVMDRTLQARLDRNYRHQRHVYDVTREYYLLGRDKLIAELQPPVEGAVLEIACGTARNLIQLGKRHAHARLFGVDLSEEMLDTARRSIAKAGMSSHVTLAHGDATSFDPALLFQQSHFDRVVISYALSMIPRWEDALQRAMETVMPGGSLHVVDFGMGENLPACANVVLRSWLARFQVTPRDALVPSLVRLADQHGASIRVEHLWCGYAVQATLWKAREIQAERPSTS